MYPFFYPFNHHFNYHDYPPFLNDPNRVFQFFTQNIQHQQVALNNGKNGEDVKTAYSNRDDKPIKEEKIEEIEVVEPREPLPIQVKVEFKVENNEDEWKPNKRHMLPKKKSKQLKNKHIKTLGSRPRYIHKNFQSNIINKIFFFMWTEDRSRPYLERMVGIVRTNLFYEYIKIVRKYSKRYINKEYLLNLCNYSEEHIAYKIVMKKVNEELLPMEEFSKIMRRLMSIYLNIEFTTSVLTSKKMNADCWRDHLDKARTIKNFLFGNLSLKEYEYQILESYSELHEIQGELEESK